MSNIYFLVKFEESKNLSELNRFTTFMKNEKFACTAGYWGCPWYFIDIENMQFKPGKPGVSYGKVINEHAITLDEFIIIYMIYKKYRNKKLLEM